jgi:hypothetical protein
MTQLRRSVAVGTVVALLGITAMPGSSHARAVHIGYRVSEHAAHEAGEDIAIGIGITAGTLAAVAGIVWYYVKHRRNATSAPSERESSSAEVPMH